MLFRPLARLPRVLSPPPEPLRMVPCRVGDGVDGFGAGLFPRERQHSLHSRDCLVCFLVAGAGLAHFTIGQTCAAPGRPAFIGRHGWAFDHLSAWIPSQSLRTAPSIDWKSSDPFSRPLMWTMQSSPGRSLTWASYTRPATCT